MGRLIDLGDRLLSGAASPADLHPWTPYNELEEIAPGAGFVSSFANVCAFDTDEGLVLVDTGSFLLASQVHVTVRGWTKRPLHTAVYTHGHVDHACGLGPFEAEGHEVRVVAHEAVPARFDRYRKTAGWNAHINARQFRMPGLAWPTDYRYPDVTFRSTLDLDIGGVRFELHHARGETDDHCWVWVPSRRILCTGDFFIWASPNAGNPQKVQRYPHEWARALREMEALDAEVLLPGHGLPITGRERVRQALSETAELLEWLHDRTVERMNAGEALETIVAEVKAPAHLLERPYLQPIYDEPEFVVRNVWRFYGGWWDGNPAHLKPAPPARLAVEIASLAGGAAALAARASELAEKGELALACHLVELAEAAAPGDATIESVRRAVYMRRAGGERSVMARGIFTAAADRDPR